MAELKTARTGADVDAFLAAVPDPRRRADAQRLCALMRRATGTEPAMWGPGIVGFGERHLVYASGRELNWFDVGFAPRKGTTTLYLTDGFEQYGGILDRLGPHTTGKGCLYVKRLDDVDAEVLAELVEACAASARGT